MIAGKRVLYWDACVFIAWLKNEQRPPGEMEGVADVVTEIDNHRAILISSVMTRTELLDCKLTDEARTLFERVQQRRDLQLINADIRVADLSHEIRNYHQLQGVSLSSPDCIHLATAILYRADEFHTFDGSGAKPKKSKLIQLSGKVAGQYPLVIKVPSCAQPSLLSALPSPTFIAPAPAQKAKIKKTKKSGA
jgi:predicted nucleic acid-binding protein